MKIKPRDVALGLLGIAVVGGLVFIASRSNAASLVLKCVERDETWLPPPPHWNPADWFEELKSLDSEYFPPVD